MSRTSQQTYSVDVYPGELRFSAAHFITFDGTCENLHGHNFHLRVRVSGANNDDAFVVDFVNLNRTAAAICAELHDRILLAGRSNEMAITQKDHLIQVQSYDKSFVFPAQNCAVLPIANTTAEMLAHHIGTRLQDELPESALSRARTLEVSVEEADQQWGTCHWELNHG